MKSLIRYFPALLLAVAACASVPALADDFAASGTWEAGRQHGTWQATLARDTNVVSGKIALTGGPVATADVAGTLAGDRIEFGVMSDTREIASFSGKVSVGGAQGTLRMANGVAGKWAGKFQAVAQADAPIENTRAGTVEAPFGMDSVSTTAPTSPGDVCDLVSGPTSRVLSGGAETALRARCGEAATGGAVSSSSLVSCDSGFPESNPPTPGTVNGDLVNDISRGQQTWPHITQSETSAYVSLVQQGQQGVAYNDTQFLNSLQSGIGYGYRVTSDGSWTENQNQFSLPNPILGFQIGSDPSGAGDRDGNLKVSYLSQMIVVPPGCSSGICAFDSRIGMSSSNDGGLTYGPPDTAIVPANFTVHDKEWLAIDWTSDATKKNTQYLCWTDVKKDCGNGCQSSQVFFARRRPGQPSFEAAVFVSSKKNFTLPSQEEVQGCQVAVAPDNSVYVLWWEQVVPLTGGLSSSIMGKRSADGAGFGSAFNASGPFTKVVDSAATTDCGTVSIKGHVRVEPYPTFAIHRQTGALYAAYMRKQTSGAFAEIAFVASTNQGGNWSIPKVVNDNGAGDKFMPAIAHSPRAGKIDIIWYDRRNDTNNVSIDVYRATSTNGGGTFSANTRLTSAAFGVPRLWPMNFDCKPGDFNKPKCYMGDYIADVNVDPLFNPVDAGGFTQAWGDNSLKFFDVDTGLNVPDPDIRANFGC